MVTEQKSLTNQEMQAIQDELTDIVGPLNEAMAEMMAIHFGFDISSTMAIKNGWTEALWRAHILSCLNEYLEGNAFKDRQPIMN